MNFFTIILVEQIFDKIFITENLTQYRNGLVKALSDLKTSGTITAYWTYDGRIYDKKLNSAGKDFYETMMTYVAFRTQIARQTRENLNLVALVQMIIRLMIMSLKRVVKYI